MSLSLLLEIFMSALVAPNVELTGRRSAQRGGDPQAQLAGGPVERRVGPALGRHYFPTFSFKLKNLLPCKSFLASASAIALMSAHFRLGLIAK